MMLLILQQERTRQTLTTVRSTPKASSEPGLCVGIASIARNSVLYFKTAVGTVLEGSSEEERADIHLILFIAQTDFSQYSAYSEP